MICLERDQNLDKTVDNFSVIRFPCDINHRLDKSNNFINQWYEKKCQISFYVSHTPHPLIEAYVYSRNLSRSFKFRNLFRGFQGRLIGG